MEINFFRDNKNTILVESRSTGLLDIFVKAQGEGSLIKEKNKTIYTFQYKKKKKERKSIIIFNKGKVIKNIAKPPRILKTNIIPISKDDLVDVRDPLSAVYDLFFNHYGNLNCNQKIKIFDGSEVFFLQLSLIKNNPKQIKSTKLIYKGSMVKCRLNYRVISGHLKKKEKKLNKMYVDIYFGRSNNNYIPYFLTNKTKLVTLKMFLKN